MARGIVSCLVRRKCNGVKAFLQEHISYIIFQLLLVLFVLLLYFLDGFRNFETALYSIIISAILITSFLAVRYMLRRRYLSKITQLPTTMEEALQKTLKQRNICRRKSTCNSFIMFIKTRCNLCMQSKRVNINL